MSQYKAVLIGCSRMGAFIDNEVPPDMRPYSHAAGYEACERTDLVACSDLRPEVMERVGARYGIPVDKQYTDYREMLDREKPDIVSVATQPEHRAEIVIAATEAGARAIYAEKAFSASLEEADRMVEACQRHNVALNMGTNRRFHPGYDQMKAVIDSGRIGALQTLIIHLTSALFNGASHSLTCSSVSTPTLPLLGCKRICPMAMRLSTAISCARIRSGTASSSSPTASPRTLSIRVGFGSGGRLRKRCGDGTGQ